MLGCVDALNAIGTLSGKKYADGRVELTCSGLDSSLTEILLGEAMEGAALTCDFTLDAEGRMTFMRFTVTLSAELTGGEAMTISSETTVDYSPAAITAPADAADYAEATYDELFGFQLPEIDPEEATALGLPVDGDNYTVGGENAAVSAEEQFYFLYLYAPYYADKTFTVYGNVTEDESGNTVISVGEVKIILSLQRTLIKIYYAYIILLFRIEILFSLK